jgi:hypothetical protein
LIRGLVNIFKNILQKHFLSIKKVKMLKKNPVAVESFVIVGLFDYDCTLIFISKDNYLDQKNIGRGGMIGKSLILL